MTDWDKLYTHIPQENGPVEPPRAITWPERYHLLSPLAEGRGTSFLIIGWGDGWWLDELIRDPSLSVRDIHVAVLPGETSLVQEFQPPVGWKQLRLQLHSVRQKDDWVTLAKTLCPNVNAVARLAGLDILTGHPLCQAAEEHIFHLQQTLIPHLSQWPLMLGNNVFDSLQGAINAIANAPDLLTGFRFPDAPQYTCPVLAVAAGPSLAMHIDQIRALQNSCLIVACDAVLHGLLDHDIRPHFVTAVERPAAAAKMVTRAAECPDCIPICRTVVPPATLQSFKQPPMAWWNNDLLHRWLMPEMPLFPSGSSSGVMTLAAALRLSSGPVYLLGHDLCYAKENSHWAGSSFAASCLSGLGDTARSILDGHNLVDIDGNDGHKQVSTGWWRRFRSQLEDMIHHSGRQIFNPNIAAGTGARITGTSTQAFPEPANLDLLKPVQLPRIDRAAHDQWQQRYQMLLPDLDAWMDQISKAEILIKDPNTPANLCAEALSPITAVPARNVDLITYLFEPLMANYSSYNLLYQRECNPESLGERDLISRLAHSIKLSLRPMLDQLRADL